MVCFGKFIDWTYFKGFNFRDFLGGEYQENFNDFFKDKLPVYNRLTFLKNNFDILTGQTVSNGVLVRGQELTKIHKLPNEGKFDLFSLHVMRFAQDLKKQAYYLFIPSKLQLNDSVFKFYGDSEIKDEIERLKKKYLIPLENNILYENSKEVSPYYRTSNRLNSYGAYLLYCSNMKKLGKNVYDIENFNIHHVVDDYYGELYSKNFGRNINPDTIDIFKFNGKDIDFSVEETYGNGTVLKRKTIYDLDRINDYDKTHVIFGGNAVLKEVETNLEEKEKLLIFSDDSINNLMQFFPLHYKKITVVNLHEIYYSKDEVFEKLKNIKKNDYDKILFIYQIESLNDDEQFRNLKYFKG